ncbi:MAG: hypothetical protein L6R42_007146 [Xanthoria sp. 1 TBL-2021]|nr:MAG: hypothetical protein L6R42_007146 [Xanthoria sp. 1 TBL-2021]
MSIRAALRSCLEAFENFIKYTETTEYNKEDEVPKSSWVSQLDRLRTWASNVNALESGNASLDHLLRDPPRPGLRKLRDHIPKLLGSIEEILHDIIGGGVSAIEEMLNEDIEDDISGVEENVSGVDENVSGVEDNFSGVEDDDSAVEDDSDEIFDNDSETPLQCFFDSVKFRLDCLEQHATLIPGSKTADALTRSSVVNNAMLTDARQSALADVEWR